MEDTHSMSMDGTTKRRLLLGFLSNWIGRLASTIIQLVQVPVFLHFWSMPLYGEWMIVNSIPTYLSFTNIGFGTVAGNEMTMMVARDDREGALRVFQSCWWLISLICSVVILLLSGALYYLPAARLLKITHISEYDTKWIIFYLGVSVLLGQLEQLLQSAYRCIGRYPYGTLLKSALLAGRLCLHDRRRRPRQRRRASPPSSLPSPTSSAPSSLCILVRHDIPWIKFGWRHASFAEIRRLARPAIAFMGFPIGNALNLQGTLLAVGYALGPVEVVIFGTARTVSRVALQMVQMVNSTFEPEMSIAYGAGNYRPDPHAAPPRLPARAHRRCRHRPGHDDLGPWFLTHWTGGHVPPSRPLLSILLLVVVFYALWSTSSTLMTSTNQHQRLAIVLHRRHQPSPAFFATSSPARGASMAPPPRCSSRKSS